MRISDWSSDVCSSDLVLRLEHEQTHTDVVVGLLPAERETGVLFELTRSRLEQASNPKPVVAVRLLAREMPPFVHAPRDLFDEPPATGVPGAPLRETLRTTVGAGESTRGARGRKWGRRVNCGGGGDSK